MNTKIIESTEKGDIEYDVFAKLISDRIVFISDYIDDMVAANSAATILYLESIAPKEPIYLFINSEGGDIRSVLMIYDVMMLCRCDIQTTCFGSATFEAALLLAAGTKGRRFATKSSLVCLSQLFAEGFTVGDLTNLTISYDQLKKDNDKVLKLISKHTGKKITELKKDLTHKKFMNASQAKSYGIIDEVLKWK